MDGHDSGRVNSFLRQDAPINGSYQCRPMLCKFFLSRVLLVVKACSVAAQEIDCMSESRQSDTVESITNISWYLSQLCRGAATCMKVKGDEKDTDAMGRHIDIGARLPQILAMTTAPKFHIKVKVAAETASPGGRS